MKISAKGGLQPLPRPVRQIWMILHVACSVGWLGVLVACLSLTLTALGSDDPVRVAALESATATLTGALFLPVTLLVLVTGVVLGLGTKWGLVKFYWVLGKLVAALVVFAVATLMAPDLATLVLLTLVTSLALVLSVLKPWGRVQWRRAPARTPALQETS
jgi:uncharacterized membrane protein